MYRSSLRHFTGRHLGYPTAARARVGVGAGGRRLIPLSPTCVKNDTDPLDDGSRVLVGDRVMRHPAPDHCIVGTVQRLQRLQRLRVSLNLLYTKYSIRHCLRVRFTRKT